MDNSPKKQSPSKIPRSTNASEHCFCGTKNSYQNCCELLHKNLTAQCTPEQLMRSRYSAFKLKDIDYIIRTYHSSCHSEKHTDEIRQACNLEWVKLEIVDAPRVKQGGSAYVEFKAWFLEDGALKPLHERSRFVQEAFSGNKYWRYIDGVFPEEAQTKNSSESKIGRNDPCPCNSQKKYKKCCFNK